MKRELKIRCACLLLVGVLSGMGSGIASAEVPKIATVDVQELFKEYHRTIATQKRFNAEYANIQKMLDEQIQPMNDMRVKLQVLVEELKEKDLSDEDRSNKEQEGQMLSQEMRILQKNIKTSSDHEKLRVRNLKAASMEGILKEIKEKVIAHAKELGVDYVFDSSGKNTNQVSFFIYLKDAKDITANMLKELNKFAPGANGK